MFISLSHSLRCFASSLHTFTRSVCLTRYGVSLRRSTPSLVRFVGKIVIHIVTTVYTKKHEVASRPKYRRSSEASERREAE